MPGHMRVSCLLTGIKFGGGGGHAGINQPTELSGSAFHTVASIEIRHAAKEWLAGPSS